ncbi:DUF2913 family protein, partial [Enterobacter sp. KBR-315C3_2022]|uniref:DUF2913 family protein n=1 Tax=Enterobacter sp. KBR-315C3_2022 TaxID=3242494 RepID=UPI0035274945
MSIQAMHIIINESKNRTGAIGPSPRAIYIFDQEAEKLKNRDKTGHLAWCALVALQLARQDGLINSESQENLFITRWFALAKKQRRFSRDLAKDIDLILNQGRSLGIRARLKHKLDYLWHSCTDDISVQNYLFRLTYALETAKDMSWNCRLLSDREWSGRNASSLKAGVNGIYEIFINFQALTEGGKIQEFRDALSKADELRIWRYFGLTIPFVPYILVTLVEQFNKKDSVFRKDDFFFILPS